MRAQKEAAANTHAKGAAALVSDAAALPPYDYAADRDRKTAAAPQLMAFLSGCTEAPVHEK